MIDHIVGVALKFRALVILGTLGILAMGIVRYRQMPVDAFPDISPVMVPVFVEAHGMAPEEIERLITFPIEAAMNGLPGVTQLKSTSAFGMAVIYVYFKDAVDIFFARQLVSERLAAASAELPELHEPPMLGPISTGLGQIFIYYLTLEEGAETGGLDTNTYLRDINDWIVKFQLQTVPGVTDILSVGGHVLQYQIRVDPFALRKYDLHLEDIVGAVQAGNRNAGGQFMVLGSEEYLVRGIGLLESLDDIRSLPLKVVRGVPVTISAVAEVEYGQEIRRGVVSHNGQSEVVSGMVLKLYGENTSSVIKHLHKKVEEIQASLPDGVSLVPYYDQADLVGQATWTVKKAIMQGALLVILVLLVFLGNLRSAFIVAISLPISALIAVICMHHFGFSANLMSLGGIAIGIGMLGDGAIVMVENIFRHLNQNGSRETPKIPLILKAANEVTRPILFSISIIIVVFLPIFTLQGIEGKMFSPIAFTLCFALLGSLITALMVSPVAASFLLKPGNEQDPGFMNRLKARYRPLLEWAIDRHRMVLILAFCAFFLSLCLVPFIGTEFIPALEEGSILIGVSMAPSISLDKAVETVMKLERKIMTFEEVEETVSRIGRPEAGSHPHPVNYAEVHIELKPPGEWKRFRSKTALVEALNAALSGYPGVQLNFTQPIQNAFDELLSGIKAQLAIKVFGEDLDLLRRKAEQIQTSIADIEGLVDVSVEQSFGQPQVQIIADRAACSRYGVSLQQILEIVELAVGGEVIDQLFLNTRRYGIHLRYQEAYRDDPESLKSLLVQTENGGPVPLSQVADVKILTGPIQINRENNQRRWVVQGNVRGRDLGSVFQEIRNRIETDPDLTLPPGYYIEYGGQFENQQRAMTRLSIIVPVVIGLAFLMLWLSFGALRYAVIIITNVPLALIGGIVGLIVTGNYLSVPAAVGFIALFGIAVQNGVVLVSSLNLIRKNGGPLRESIITAGMTRLRPVMMTAMTTVLGLLPLLLAHGPGSEIQRPLAVVVVFGLTTSTLLTLFVIPAAYAWSELSRRNQS